MQQSSSNSSSTASTTSNTVATNPTGSALPKARFNWIFPAEKFNQTPSMREGLSVEEELTMRQLAAVFIHELGNNLKLPHYCVNTAVVYMHRFYMINSFQRFTRHRVCAASLFLACKVEEFPRALREVIENTSKILRKKRPEDLTKEMITQYAEDIVIHENILLSTLGFSLMVDHPHSLIVKTIQTLGSQIQSLPEKTPRELAQTAYYLATKSILLTSFCVKYPPDLIACFCIHLAAAWLKIEMPTPAPSNNSTGTNSESEPTEANNSGGRRWFHEVNPNFTEKQLGELADEFLAIYEKCPDKIKKKLVYQNERPTQSNSHDTSSGLPQNSGSRPADLADSVVPQGASKHDKIEPHRQAQPPLPSNRSHQPPLPPPVAHPPPPPPPLPSHPHPSSSSSSGVKRDSAPPAPTFSSNNRQAMQSRSASAYQGQQNHYHGQHHSNHNYQSHSRYPPHQQRPNSLPPHRSSQQPGVPPMPPQHNMDRKPPPHPYEHAGHPPPVPPSSNRGSYGSQQRTGQYNHVAPPGNNPYPPPGPYMNHSHPPSLMNVSGEKRAYDSSYDPNNHKRARPSIGSTSSSSQQWNNK